VTVQLMMLGPSRADEIEADARRGWRDHPEFVAEIVRLAREDRALDPTARLSIGELFVVAKRNLRQVGIHVQANHNWRRPWASWLMAEHTDLDGAFVLRDTTTDQQPARGTGAQGGHR
jgi:hypothetical protein